MSIIHPASLLLLLLFISTIVLAEMPAVNSRQTIQRQRVENATNAGQLTPREEIRLNRQQKRIERAEKAASSDGVITRRERAVLRHKQNRASRNIYRKSHNRRR